MSWSNMLDNVVLPLVLAAAGWFARRYLSAERRQVAQDVGERFARYAEAAAQMTLTAMEAGHVPAQARALVSAWRARFVALARAAGYPASREVQLRAAGKAARALLRGMGAERAATLAAALEAVLLAGDFLDETTP